jgi:hypothetical protein
MYPNKKGVSTHNIPEVTTMPTDESVMISIAPDNNATHEDRAAALPCRKEIPANHARQARR